MLEAYDLAYNAEMENVKTFEFDSNELRAAVDVISSMGAAMPAECRDYLLNRFRGNYLALCCIVELFRKYELLDNGYQVFSPTVEFTTLRECMKSIVNDPQKSCNGIAVSYTHLEEYGEVTETCPHHGRNIENSAHFGAGKGREPMNKQGVNNNIKKAIVRLIEQIDNGDYIRQIYNKVQYLHSKEEVIRE